MCRYVWVRVGTSRDVYEEKIIGRLCFFSYTYDSFVTFTWGFHRYKITRKRSQNVEMILLLALTGVGVCVCV